jgi:glycosyltransferase domain-containing protein
MRDFTLLIPTYNRPQLLAALLGYLETEKADCRVLVLDSSHPERLATNRKRVAGSSLDVEFAEFPDLDPTDKWRRGLHEVTTPFCGFCADDDLVILGGVRRCLDTIRSSPAASVVQGHSFSFLPRPDGDIELSNIVYFRPTIGDSTPLRRLDSLFRQYQAPSYGVFRAPALRRIFDALPPAAQILTRELMWSALAAIEGQLIRLPDFSYGRGMGPSAGYGNWHPLEWFCKDADSLFAEYRRYRGLLASAVLQRADNEHRAHEINEVLDLIHLRYLTRHAPHAALEFIAQQQIAGAEFAEYWPRYEIHLPLYHAAGIAASEESATLGPATMRGRDRSYILFPSFYAPHGLDPPQLSSIVRLIAAFDNYRPAMGRDVAPRAECETD